MTVDPLMRACCAEARCLIGPGASEAEMIWATLIAYLFATGALAESNLTTTLQ